MPYKENHYVATKLQDSFNLFPEGLLMNITHLELISVFVRNLKGRKRIDIYFSSEIECMMGLKSSLKRDY